MMDWLVQTMLLQLATRATLFLVIIVVALLIGEPLARLLRLPQLRRALTARIVRLNTKLNRPSRSIATRLYRGIVATFMVVLPAMLVTLALTLSGNHTAIFLILMLVFGEALAPYRTLRIWRQAKTGKLNLQSQDPEFLFADIHARLRYEIIRVSERFAVVFVGGSVAFLLAGLVGMAIYFALAASARIFSLRQPENRAFGWAANGLFQLVDALPRFIARILLWIAAFTVPRGAPFSALRQLTTSGTAYYGYVASLLGLSFGGRMPHPSGELALPWLGQGNPKPVAHDYTRALWLITAANLLWVCLLGSSIYLLPFIK
jgi:cobalamin biosynthesis protein CobD/CbiB